MLHLLWDFLQGFWPCYTLPSFEDWVEAFMTLCPSVTIIIRTTTRSVATSSSGQYSWDHGCSNPSARIALRRETQMGTFPQVALCELYC
jgi:hypothetical protein